MAGMFILYVKTPINTKITLAFHVFSYVKNMVITFMYKAVSHLLGVESFCISINKQKWHESVL